jgi:hypothetical protein
MMGSWHCAADQMNVLSSAEKTLSIDVSASLWYQSPLTTKDESKSIAQPHSTLSHG